MAVSMEQFHQTFFEESFEGLDCMESALLNLEVGGADPEVINSIFRAAHSIKGGSATFGFSDVAGFTHLLETLLDEMRDGRRAVTQPAVDLLLRAIDCVRAMLQAVQNGDDADDASVHALQRELEGMLAAQSASQSSATQPAAVSTAAGGAGWAIRFHPHADILRTGNDPLRILRELDTLGDLEVEAELSRLPTLRELDPERCYLGWTLRLHGAVPRTAVDEAFAWVADEADITVSPLEAGASANADAHPPAQGEDDGQDLHGELVMERRVGERRSEQRRVAAGATADNGSIRVSIDKVDAVINLVGELVITQSMLSTLGQDFDMTRVHKLRDGLAQLERNSRELQESVMRIRMLPISFVFNRFPRLVRDLSTRLGKKVDLRMSGEGTEVDKTVIEKMADPLVHLVRNALDHGVESPAERLAAGKPETGTVHLDAYHKSGNIIIEIRDDGRGLDHEAILAKAVERGVVAADARLAPEQIHELIFLPGFSTAQNVSDVSGRGVGMDVVRSNIRSVGGTVEVGTERGRGSTFTIRLPLTLAILDGQSVAVGKEVYIIPLVSIVESIQVEARMVNEIAGKGEVFRWRDEHLPVIRLYRTFGAQARATQLTDGLIVVVEGDGRRVGLFVDELLGQQQVVIKSLEANYRKVEGISGATILGDGSVALILDIPGLIRLAGE